MDPSESALYPMSYYRDMAFFIMKSMTHIFKDPDAESNFWFEQSESGLVPTSLRKADAPVIAVAINDYYASEFEFHLYEMILGVLEKSMLDESVPVGTVVLLDLLGDLYKMGRFVDGDYCRLPLPCYPDKDYWGYFAAAFMLAYRLLSKDKPVEEGYWEHVMDHAFSAQKVRDLESTFRGLLEENTTRYPLPPISSRDTYKFHYVGDRPVPPNPLIPRLPYLRTKWTMYQHIYLLMQSRGEPVPTVDRRRKWKKKDFLLQFPPCYDYMMSKDILFLETRTRVPHLWEASHREVSNYLEAERMMLEERHIQKPRVGLGLFDSRRNVLIMP